MNSSFNFLNYFIIVDTNSNRIRMVYDSTDTSSMMMKIRTKQVAFNANLTITPTATPSVSAEPSVAPSSIPTSEPSSRPSNTVAPTRRPTSKPTKKHEKECIK